MHKISYLKFTFFIYLSDITIHADIIDAFKYRNSRNGFFSPFYPKLVQINGENLYKFIFTNTQI